MFGPRRRYGRRGGGGGGGFGLVLLAIQLFQFLSHLSRRNEFFPATLGLLAVNIAAFLRPGGIPWPSIREACISFKGVCLQREWQRLIFSPFIHASDFHLYYNMASFMWKAISLERSFGSGYFLYMVGVFSAATGTLYLAINYALAEVLNQWSYINSCAVGFSGVIFALKVVTTHLQPGGMSRIMGIPVPMKLACWVELVLISVLFPNVSFVGHLAGILVGLAFVSGPLKMIMDIPLTFANASGIHSGERSYTYQASATGHRASAGRAQPSRSRPQRSERQQQTYTSYTYSSGSTGYRGQRAAAGVTDSEEEQELQEAIRQSLAHDHTQATPTPSAPPPSDDHEDEDVRMAMERSLADLSHTERSGPTSPPPYNPSFSSSQDHGAEEGNIHETETVIVGDTESDVSSEVRRRRGVSGAGGVADTPRDSGGRSRTVQQPLRTRTDDIESIRAARLRRFSNTINH